MKVPVVRGVVAFVRSLVSGMTTLMESADILEKYAPEEYAGQETRFEKWVNSKFGDKAAWNILMTLSLVLAIVISIALFVIFPTWAVNFLGKWITSTIVLNLIEGILRILIFVGYIVLIRRMEEINTLFRYHGAEHKTIHCYENNLELTPENARVYGAFLAERFGGYENVLWLLGGDVCGSDAPDTFEALARVLRAKAPG